jgi:glycosyltransferase involved in cell wall biosynthesis
MYFWEQSSAEQRLLTRGGRGVISNVLFVLYHDFTANSATHVHAISEELNALGYECQIAVPQNKESVAGLGACAAKTIDFADAETGGVIYSNGRGPDIIHAWTPREVVRRFCEAVRIRYASQLFVHLEDNEFHILSRNVGKPVSEILALSFADLDRLIPPSFSHPHRANEFLRSATGVTIIIDKLAEFVPAGPPIMELWPSASRGLFKPRSQSASERKRYGIPNNSTVLVYTGNTHGANAREMRSLYLAVAILNREGHSTTLVRAGRDYCPFLGPDETWARRHSIELGMTPHCDIPPLLALADVLVQPGQPGEFNDYRFPSKLPEFFSVGRPVVLPRSNIARYMTHGEHGYIVSDLNAVAIADAVRTIMEDRDLYSRLAAGAVTFFNSHLDWAISAKKLSDFYQSATNPTAETASRAPAQVNSSRAASMQ